MGQRDTAIKCRADVHRPYILHPTSFHCPLYPVPFYFLFPNPLITHYALLITNYFIILISRNTPLGVMSVDAVILFAVEEAGFGLELAVDGERGAALKAIGREQLDTIRDIDML